MVSALISRSSCPGSSPGRRHCIVFLSKTLYSHSASLFLGALMGTGELNAGVLPCDGLTSHPGGLIMEITPSRFMLLKPG